MPKIKLEPKTGKKLAAMAREELKRRAEIGHRDRQECRREGEGQALTRGLLSPGFGSRTKLSRRHDGTSPLACLAVPGRAGHLRRAGAEQLHADAPGDAAGPRRGAGRAAGHGALAAWSGARLAALGLAALLNAGPWLYLVLRTGGGLYLIWFAVAIWRAKADGAPVEAAQPAGIAELLAGLRVNMTNPKSVLFFASIFSAYVGPDTPGWVHWAAVADVTLVCVCRWPWLPVLHPRAGRRLCPGAAAAGPDRGRADGRVRAEPDLRAGIGGAARLETRHAHARADLEAACATASPTPRSSSTTWRATATTTGRASSPRRSPACPACASTSSSTPP